MALDLRGRGRVSGRPRGRPRVVANIHVGKPQTLSGERSKDLSTKVRISLALSINCHLQSPFFDYFFANRVIEAAAVKVFATNFPLGRPRQCRSGPWRRAPAKQQSLIPELSTLTLLWPLNTAEVVNAAIMITHSGTQEKPNLMRWELGDDVRSGTMLAIERGGARDQRREDEAAG